MDRVRFGLIGVGRHGGRYAGHLAADIPGAELVAICRRDRAEGERLAAAHGCAYYPDYATLVADDRVDAVAVAVPPALHGAIVEAACRAGKHLLIEKPLAVDVAAARRIRDLVAASGVRCMVAHTLRFNEVVQALKARVPEIAPLHQVYLSQRFEPSPLPWLDRHAEAGGGIILHTGVHSFDLLRYLTGAEVERVWCRSGRVFTAETEDNFAMTCRLSAPLLLGAVMGSRSTAGRNGLIELSGENGQLVGDHVHGWAYLLRGRDRTPIAVGPPRPTVRETLRAFVDALRSGAPFPITIDDGLRAVAIADACYRAAETGHAGAVDLSDHGVGPRAAD